MSRDICHICEWVIDRGWSGCKCAKPHEPAMKDGRYRGWSIDWDYGRFTATGPNYDASWEGEEDGWVASGGSVEERTREGLIAEIDAWIEEHPGDAA